MKQRGRNDEHGHWHGHRELSEAATALLFAERIARGQSDRLLGLDQEQFAAMVDAGQAREDRALAWESYTDELTGEQRRSILGRTMLPPDLDEAAQIRHAMASDLQDGNRSWDRIYRHIRTEFLAAVEATTVEDATAADAEAVERRLGAAAHALQDSYSSAHAWRHPSVYAGNAEAPIQSLNTFSPLPSIGIPDRRDTHFEEFDSPPADSGSVQAATESTYRLLRAFEAAYDHPEQAERIFEAELAPLLARVENVEVNADNLSLAWQKQRDLRFALEGGVEAAPPAPRLEGVEQEVKFADGIGLDDGPVAPVVRVVAESRQEASPGQATEIAQLRAFIDQPPHRSAAQPIDQPAASSRPAATTTRTQSADPKGIGSR